MGDNTSFVDYYELLGVPTDADPAAVRLAFLRLAKEHHPDVGGSTDTMQQYTAAYRTLMSETSRKAYDRLHDFHTGNSQAQYRDYGKVQGSSTDDLTDDEIDDFLDEIFAEYHNQPPKPKESFKSRLKKMF
jgi:curved DNA-binding protein CbpA